MVREHRGSAWGQLFTLLAAQDHDALRLLHPSLQQVVHTQDGADQEDGALRLEHLHDAQGGRRGGEDDDGLVPGQVGLPKRPQEGHDLRPDGAPGHEQGDQGGVREELLGLLRLARAEKVVHELLVLVVAEVGARDPPQLRTWMQGRSRSAASRLARSPDSLDILDLHLSLLQAAELHHAATSRRRGLGSLSGVVSGGQELDAPVAGSLREGRAHPPA
mmetsp:Transcript_31711/g.91047  ORF Transcript_31711/g.91047 Transcript_31711/m.91047 type:complete len:218 (-) Transcript_31711:1820-2473(-)